MLKVATEFNQDVSNLKFQEGSAEQLPFPDEEFDLVVCSMTINTFSSQQLVEIFFQEVARVFKSGGRLGISLPHPLTLDFKTKFRWTQWKEGQTQQKLVPGEAVERKIMGRGGEMLTVINYFWPPDVLINIAGRHHLVHKKTIEQLATEKDIQQYPELDPALQTTPFFLVMAFDKK